MTNRTLQGAIALVTGARGGLGRAICGALVKEGATVIGTATSAGPVDSKVDTWFKLDVTSQDEWMHVAGEVRRRFGRLDCLINNAGIAMVESIAEMSAEKWRRAFSVNVDGALFGMQSMVPLMREGGDRTGGSSIVNVSSTAGLRGVAFNSAYCASKGALRMLSRCAAKEFSALKYPIRVNSIYPGNIETAMMGSILSRYVDMGLAGSAEEQKAVFVSRSPSGRVARPDEVAGAVAFLCSPAAGYMTGAELVIDAGFTA